MLQLLIMHYELKTLNLIIQTLLILFNGTLNAILGIAYEWKMINKYEKSSVNEVSNTNFMKYLLI